MWGIEMKQGALVSIIIPIYNAEKYIGTMLDSILGQTYDLLDVILVNDGSTDETKRICMSYVKRDPRIRYLEQDNRGPSAARNRGLACAKGTYVLFADADDFIPAKAIEKLIKSAVETKADVVVGCFGEIRQPNGVHYIIVDKDEAICAALCGNTYLSNVAGRYQSAVNMGATCGKLVKRELLQKYNLAFSENITHREDLLYFIHVYAYSGEICILYESVYVYRQINKDSLVKRFHTKKIEELYAVTEALADFQKNIRSVDDSVVYEFMMHTVYRGWDSYFAHCKNPMSVGKLYKELKKYILDDKVRGYICRRSGRLDESFSLFQRIVFYCMEKKQIAFLTLLAYTEKKFKNILEG